MQWKVTKNFLRIAGVDDMQMCELSLEETGLCRKKGAEILAADFDREWNGQGGHRYIRQNKNDISSEYIRKRLGKMTVLPAEF